MPLVTGEKVVSIDKIIDTVIEEEIILDSDNIFVQLEPPVIKPQVLMEETVGIELIIDTVIEEEEVILDIVPEDVYDSIEDTKKYMADFIEVNWDIASPEVDLSDAPDLIIKRQMLIIILNDVKTVYGLPSYRESLITMEKQLLLSKGITILDDSIFSYSMVQKREMFFHETEGLLGIPSMPEEVIRKDPEASEWLSELAEESWNALLRKILIVIVIVLIVIVLGLIGFEYVKSYVGAKAQKRAMT